MILRVQLFLIIVITVTSVTSDFTRLICGCKTTRQCYHDMLTALQEPDEKACIEDVEVGSSTLMVYFFALKKYCGHIFNYTASYKTFESRDLYEVEIFLPNTDNEVTRSEKLASTPVILIDAGQSGGREPVILALLLIERLMACEENEPMIQKVRWIILPSANPDGLEQERFDHNTRKWLKNTRRDISEDGAGYGVDISRNFDSHWEDCGKNKNTFSIHYPGPMAASEAETKFVQDMILKYKRQIKAYLSIRRDGHSILYPYSYCDKKAENTYAYDVAALISRVVSQRGSVLTSFMNDSMFRMTGKERCGNSVDYAHNQGISVALEMRVGYQQDLETIQIFQHLPTGFISSLRMAYIAGFKELFSIIATQSQKYTLFR